VRSACVRPEIWAQHDLNASTRRYMLSGRCHAAHTAMQSLSRYQNVKCQNVKMSKCQNVKMSKCQTSDSLTLDCARMFDRISMIIMKAVGRLSDGLVPPRAR
jgi:hypothetical protein